MPETVAPSGSGQSSELLRVVIVDDHEVLRAGTRQVLETAQDIIVVGEADGGQAALAMIGELQPDVVLIDVRMSDGNGIDVARQVTAEHSNVRVVILSAYNDGDLVRRAFDAGVTGYLLKTMPRNELISAVRTAGMGTTVLDPAVSAHLAQADRARATSEGRHITARERQVVALVADGLSNKAIAARLGVSTRTVEGHINHVFTKLGIESRTELVRFALTNGLLVQDSSVRLD
jgi:DNA-binding NarL/FixJ family response regulator